MPSFSWRIGVSLSAVLSIAHPQLGECFSNTVTHGTHRALFSGHTSTARRSHIFHPHSSPFIGRGVVIVKMSLSAMEAVLNKTKDGAEVQSSQIEILHKMNLENQALKKKVRELKSQVLQTREELETQVLYSRAMLDAANARVGKPKSRNQGSRNGGMVSSLKQQESNRGDASSYDLFSEQPESNPIIDNSEQKESNRRDPSNYAESSSAFWKEDNGQLRDMEEAVGQLSLEADLGLSEHDDNDGKEDLQEGIEDLDAAPSDLAEIKRLPDLKDLEKIEAVGADLEDLPEETFSSLPGFIDWQGSGEEGEDDVTIESETTTPSFDGSEHARSKLEMEDEDWRFMGKTRIRALKVKKLRDYMKARRIPDEDEAGDRYRKKEVVQIILHYLGL